jgi:hypothetical protein
MKLIIAPTAAALLTAPSLAASCRDAKGKCHIASGPTKGAFTKCP